MKQRTHSKGPALRLPEGLIDRLRIILIEIGAFFGGLGL